MDIKKWVAADSPVELRSGSAAPASSIPNAIVIEALKSLTSSVNLGTGLGHPSDHDAAVWTFRALMEAGVPFDPDEVRAWAASHGWRMAAADELGDFAQRILDGRRIRTRSRPWKTEIVDIWRRRAEGADD